MASRNEESFLEGRRASGAQSEEPCRQARTGGVSCSSSESDDLMQQPNDEEELVRHGLFAELTRRRFIQASSVVTASLAFGMPAFSEQQGAATTLPVSLKVNGKEQTLDLDSRTSLLDALREHLDLTGTKKGCDHGQCGACTVLIDGRRVNSCLTLACTVEGAEITTIEGLSQRPEPRTVEELSPVQAAFLMHDGYQCGYCTPGQIISATALLSEQQKGELSIVSWQAGKNERPELDDDEVRERMSGNICRCGAYPNIVAAVRAAAKGMSA